VLLTALSTKEAASIVLNVLELSAVETWGNRVIDFEKKYKVAWDRTTIPQNVRDQINIRWSQEIYHVHLPATLVTNIESGDGFADDQWLDPHTISTEELYKYLKKSSSMEKKRTSFKTGFEEVLEYIKSYKLSFGTGIAHKSVEKFLAQSKRLYQESKETITHHEEKELCKATRKMVEEAQQSNADMLERAVEKIMVKTLGSKETRTFMECHQLISTGFQQAMQLVINNEAFADISPMRKRDRDIKSPKDRYGNSPKERPRSKKESPDRKKERHSPPPRSEPYNTGTAVDPKDICNGCGRRLTDKHTEGTCYYILDKLEGYNPDYKTVKWHDSTACAKLRKEGKPDHLLFLSAPRERKASGGGGEILCYHISNPSLNPLPIVPSILLSAQQDRNEGVTTMEEEEDIETGNPQGIDHLIRRE